MDSGHDKTVSGVPLPDPSRVEAARARLSIDRLSARAWAEANGEAPALVAKVLTGRRACIMGASRRIALKLDIIDEVASHA